VNNREKIFNNVNNRSGWYPFAQSQKEKTVGPVMASVMDLVNDTVDDDEGANVWFGVRQPVDDILKTMVAGSIMRNVATKIDEIASAKPIRSPRTNDYIFLMKSEV
jgi:hypothetical protein